MYRPQVSVRYATGREWLGLGVLSLVAFVTSVDVFVLLLALPDISRELGATAVQQLWITDVYGFMLVGFMITAGTLGDRIGRRRLLLAGATVFAVASIVAAFSGSPEMLIAARGVLGIAGATLAPATLGLISGMFPDPRQRAVAVSVWQMCFMGGALVGPVLGGLLIGHFWWGSVFLLGVPAMVLLLVLGPFTIVESGRRGAGRLDLVSVGLCLGAILPTVHGLKELANSGPQLHVGAAVGLGVAFGVWFVRRQRRLDDPLLDVSLFTNRAFAAIALIMVLVTVVSALMFFTAQYLQLVARMTALEAAFAMLPAAVTSLLAIAATPYLARTVRPVVIIVAGMLVAGFGAWLFTTLAASGDASAVIVGLAIATGGNSPVVALGTTLILAALPTGNAGSAGAIAETGTEFGFAFGVAVLGSLATVVYRARLVLPEDLPPAAQSRIHDGLPGAVDTGLPAALDAARTAYVLGLHAVGWAVVGVAGTIALLGIAFLRRLPEVIATDGRSATSKDEDGGTRGI
ncbi:MFS transporter [Plantactinospora soyae]|uniref:DHA2 family multidrug resistance protein-like MFS transporter n=1 Tax=Plantactinospora soyae TaxID=1544732 RepID=A0A927MHK7_9ACTN|nr:MFS transporter [Plantactinospora soyae]MBE1491828.1 DHA2 family multidrug resistance protein-like MFS transporter [Plantactinospora soyae]